jgi:superfamily II DNA or RNA helicase
MKLSIENHRTTVDGNEDELDWLHDYLVQKRPKFVFDVHERRSVYAGIEIDRLFDLELKTFPTGFLPQVRKRAPDVGIEVEIEDRRVRHCAPDPGADLSWLRDYQLEAVAAALRRERGILQLGTGAGKGTIAVALTQSLPTARTLFLVDSAQLVRDVYARFESHGVSLDGVGIASEHGLGKRITLSTFQFFREKLRTTATRNFLAGIDLLLGDECHASAAASFMRVIDRCTKAYWRFGLSATPLARGDKRSNAVVGAFGPVIFKLQAERLIAAGVLARPVIRFMRYSAPDVMAGMWTKVRQFGIIECKERNAAVIAAAIRAEKPALVFVDILEHGHLLQRELQDAGLNVAFVWGDAKAHARDAAAKKLMRGELDVVVCSAVWTKGVDLPHLAACVNAAGGKSVIAILQRLGRGMRRPDGKTTFEYWDFEDTTHRILEAHTKSRMHALKAEGHDVQVDTSAAVVAV